MNIKNVKGIGEKSLISLNKIGIYNFNDLITYYPFKYNVLKRSNVDLLNNNDQIIIDGIVESIPNLSFLVVRIE